MSVARSCWVVLPVAQRADGTWLDAILQERLREAPLAGKPPYADGLVRARIEVVRADDPESEVNERFYRRGWTDGLPIVAPTLARVEEMLRGSPLSRAEALGEMDPLGGVVTVEKLAANAVMAGCRPEHFPVVIAAVRGLLDPAFNLRGVQTTDENATPLLIVSGPVIGQLGLNCGIGALGPGWQANATIGRALRLVMSNVGGGWPGVVSLAGIGQPGRYTLCVGERGIPGWPALHVESGLSAADSAVTLMRAESAVNVTGDLDDIASTMASAVSAFGLLHGGKVAVLIAPYIARKLAAQGWTKRDVARYLHECARIPADQWRRLWVRKEIAPTYGLPEFVKRAEPSGPVPIVQSADDITVFAAGGDAPIAQHVYFPTWGFPPCRVTVPIASNASHAADIARDRVAREPGERSSGS